MKAAEKESLNDFLIKAQCLYSGKVLAQFEAVSFSDDSTQSAQTAQNAALQQTAAELNIPRQAATVQPVQQSAQNDAEISVSDALARAQERTAELTARTETAAAASRTAPTIQPQMATTQAEQPHQTQNVQSAAEIAQAEEATAALQNVAQKIAACSRCPLVQHRIQSVPGIGVPQPLVLVIGEAPGADEDKTGEPFVGKAGQLLDKMLSSIQLSRKTNCFIANIVKCRPQGNRDPMPEETEACASFLQTQIQILKPKVILAAGRIAAQNLLATKTGITKLHGHFYEYQNIPLMATYHPSALLRDESLKRPAWEDLKLLRTRLLEIDPDYQQKYSLSANGQ